MMTTTSQRWLVVVVVVLNVGGWKLYVHVRIIVIASYLLCSMLDDIIETINTMDDYENQNAAIEILTCLPYEVINL